MVSSTTKQSDFATNSQPPTNDRHTSKKLDESDVAVLSVSRIAGMSRDELIEAICVVNHWQPGRAGERALNERLQFFDEPTLQRLVYLARRCCRNRRN